MRPFLAPQLTLGGPGLQAQLHAGYGRPYHTWVGAEVNAQSTTAFASGYAGVRAAMPGLEIGIGVRHTYSLSRALLMPLPVHDADEVRNQSGPKARYDSVDLQTLLGYPVPGGYAVAILSGSYVFGVPESVHLFEEVARAVMAPPWIGRGSLAYLFVSGPKEHVKFGPTVDAVWLPGRGAGILRLGPLAIAQLSNHITLVTGFALVVSSPDHLGLTLGASGVATIRYEWATGETRLRFP